MDDVTTPLRHDEEEFSLEVVDNYSYQHNDNPLLDENAGPLPKIKSAHSPLRWNH